jgi:hypothetical protein
MLWYQQSVEAQVSSYATVVKCYLTHECSVICVIIDNRTCACTEHICILDVIHFKSSDMIMGNHMEAKWNCTLHIP